MSAPFAPDEFDWLVSRLVEAAPGIEQAVVVSADGLLLAASDGSCADSAEQLAAITAGMQSLAEGVARLFGRGPPSRCCCACTAAT
ncbi:roadblock/LC7 domain-containing protein [Thermobifida halotolerans]|uniref:roadblock/LC7 domain-containing protein n=1 Tax=Thermobifida halotolerans TaxID=483545 RepID=UPI000B1F2A69|nr:roadblock/LC7 domain-containing protein [Thermobifida halotolerans]